MPDRAKVDNTVENDVDAYFRIARGRAKQNDCCATHAGEMTKWFDTNYHYIVPEFSSSLEALQNNQNIISDRKASTLATNLRVQEALSQIQQSRLTRADAYKVRIKVQQALLNLPCFPTTTIGSFPQTAEICKTRREFINGDITDVAYENALKAQIANCIQQQESLGLDVLVHGESERNDMVEYCER